MVSTSIIVRKAPDYKNIYETVGENFDSWWVIDKMEAIEYDKFGKGIKTGREGRVSLLSTNGNYSMINIIKN